MPLSSPLPAEGVADATRVVDTLEAALVPAGLDLIRPLALGWYNDAVPPAFRLPDLGRAGALAVVIGNTRALWDPFVKALRAQPARLTSRDPLDEWVMERVSAAVASTGVVAELRFSQELPPRRVAMQTLAEVAGLAWRSPAQLCVHPRFGPWIGLRAAVVFDVEGPAGDPVPAPRACGACAEACSVATERALSSTSPGGWRPWLAARDACPLGREHRYVEEQVLYHYAKDRAALARAVSASDAAPPPR